MLKKVHKLNIILPLLLILARLVTFFLPSIYLQANNKIANWNNWDASHFLYLSQHGYTNIGDEANFIVFPPLYPLAIRMFDLIFSQTITAAIVVSNVFFVLGSLILYEFLIKKYSVRISLLTIFFINIFPTSYFFSSPYTESLFFFLVSCCLFSSHKKHWTLAGIFAGLSFLTRHPGIFLFPSIVFLIYTSKTNRTDRLVSIIKFAAPFLACVLTYLWINYWVYQNPLAFQDILSKHWHKQLSFPWVGLRGSWNIAKGGLEQEYSRMIGVAEAVPATIALLLIIPMYKIVKDRSLVILYTTTVVFLCSTNFLLSTLRYLVSIPTLFIFLAHIASRSKLFLLLWSFLSIILLTYFTIIFTNGQWAF